MRLNRRGFVVAAPLVPAAAGAWLALADALLLSTSASDLLRELVKDLPTAQALGRAYLESGIDRGAAVARAQVLVASAPDRAALRNLIRRQSDAELRRDAVVLIDGWLVARTEADILALTTLLRA